MLALGEGQRPQEAWDLAVKAAQDESKLPETLKSALTPGWAAEKFGMTSIRLLQAIEVGLGSRVFERGLLYCPKPGHLSYYIMDPFSA